ncbi:MAG: S-methyl-5-thioribose-1-phosphate isomerase [Treponema sp.]|jgi:methylthioribose-1-phosphate isomerase|nr:S-methyl-5-thioribose-1-phosphate isomerase [Treponema sp.]
MAEDILSIDSAGLDEEKKALRIIDQTKLPGKVEILRLTRQEDIFEAIRSLRVRGAPAIGVAAAIGAYLAALEIKGASYDAFYQRFKKAKDCLASSRPTAANLFWALDRMEKVVLDHAGEDPEKIKGLLHDEAVKIRDEDVEVCRTIGEHALALLRDGDGILTHCNAGKLAAVRYGTALAAVHLGRERGMNFKVFCDETRPLLQGARLTAFEMVQAGVDTTLICDNMAGEVMKKGWVNACFTGCDRVAANGDAANKIGTLSLAILAKHYGIPFYICAPVSTIDMTIKEGKDIVIEERKAEEVTEMWYGERMAPEGVKVFNPAFDVTDHGLITAIITEFGIARPPYSESLKAVFGKKAGAAHGNQFSTTNGTFSAYTNKHK